MIEVLYRYVVIWFTSVFLLDKDSNYNGEIEELLFGWIIGKIIKIFIYQKLFDIYPLEKYMWNLNVYFYDSTEVS